GAPAGSLLSRGLAVHLRPDPAESAAVLGCVGQLSFPPAVALQIRALAGDRDPAPDLEGLDLDRRREILSLREVRELLVEGRSPFTDRRPQAI
ncbi:MAG TPA: hypothetical protein PKA64_23050, partial [Myxococcota bacterium]|nr:hypothetical protein [Myxococcota bacterium]